MIQFQAAGGGEQLNMPVSFGFLLPATPAVNYIPAAGPADPDCPGTPKDPQSSAGNLCVYESRRQNLGSVAVYTTTTPFALGADRFGFKVLGTAAAAGLVTVEGSWAVTA